MTSSSKYSKKAARSRNALFEVLEERTLLAIAAGPIVNPANGHSYYLLTPSSWTKQRWRPSS